MNKRIAIVVTLISLGIAAAKACGGVFGQVDVLGAVQSAALALMVMGLLFSETDADPDQRSRPAKPLNLNPSTRVR